MTSIAYIVNFILIFAHTCISQNFLSNYYFGMKIPKGKDTIYLNGRGREKGLKSLCRVSCLPYFHPYSPHYTRTFHSQILQLHQDFDHAFCLLFHLSSFLPTLSGLGQHKLQVMSACPIARHIVLTEATP